VRVSTSCARASSPPAPPPRRAHARSRSDISHSGASFSKKKKKKHRRVKNMAPAIIAAARDARRGASHRGINARCVIAVIAHLPSLADSTLVRRRLCVASATSASGAAGFDSNVPLSHSSAARVVWRCIVRILTSLLLSALQYNNRILVVHLLSAASVWNISSSSGGGSMRSKDPHGSCEACLATECSRYRQATPLCFVWCRRRGGNVLPRRYLKQPREGRRV